MMLLTRKSLSSCGLQSKLTCIQGTPFSGLLLQLLDLPFPKLTGLVLIALSTRIVIIRTF